MLGDIMKFRMFLAFKMALGFIIGMLIALAFDLDSFYTAGVIALLSLEPTRRASFESGAIRLINSLFALALASLFFYLFGFKIWILFIFVAVFVPISFLLKIDKGIVVSLVLVSQIYLSSNFYYSLNALYIFLIGLGVALLLNLYMPKNKHIKKEIDEIDLEINNLLQFMANSKIINFDQVDYLLNKTYNNIKLELDNINLALTTKRLKYVEMRKEQVSILKRINQVLISVLPIEEKTIILDFIKEFDGQIGEENYAAPLALKLEELFSFFKVRSLPTDRFAFENRAQLYYVLQELNQFLNLKLTYHQTTENL